MDNKKFLNRIDGKVLSCNEQFLNENKLKGVYSCDLLSLVMSKNIKDYVWITVHTNINIVAVATFCEISCIIIPEDIKIEEITLNRAITNDITIISSKLNSYEIITAYNELLNIGD